jgi:hypothetical protein
MELGKSGKARLKGARESRAKWVALLTAQKMLNSIPKFHERFSTFCASRQNVQTSPFIFVRE